MMKRLMPAFASAASASSGMNGKVPMGLRAVAGAVPAHSRLPQTQQERRERAATLQQRMEYLGRVPPELEARIKASPGVQKAVQDSLAADKKSYGHELIYGRGVDWFSDSPESEAEYTVLARDLHKWATGLDDGFDIIAIRILFTNPGCKEQPWHIDYGTSPGIENTALVVALTEVPDNNTTEFVVFDRDEDHQRLLEDGKKSAELGIPPTLRLGQFPHRRDCIVMKPYEAAVGQLGSVIHRRGPNESNLTRMVLAVDLTLKTDSDFVDENAVSTGPSGHLPGHEADDLRVCFRD